MAQEEGTWSRRLTHATHHPFLWARYVWLRDVRHREVRFRDHPRFRDWSLVYRVARAPLARLLGVPASELDPYFEELAPLQRDLTREVGDLLCAGALTQAPILYVLVRATRPERLVETGVSSGYSARFFLEALRRNGAGTLHSIGIQTIAVAPGQDRTGGVTERPIGWLVPPELRDRWELHIGPSEQFLEEVLADPRTHPLDLFLHDSAHLYDRMTSEYRAAWPYLRPGGFLLSHDIHNNRAWPDFLGAHGLTGAAELDRDLGAVRVPAATPPRTAPG